MPSKSIATFPKEMKSVGDIPGLLWGSLIEFRRQENPFRSFERNTTDPMPSPPVAGITDRLAYAGGGGILDEPPNEPIEETG